MRRIALLTILLVSVVFLLPTYAGKPEKAPSGVKAYDANGQYLGIVMHHDGIYAPQIFVTSYGKFINVETYSADRLKSLGTTVSLYYNDANCIGESYIGANLARADHIFCREDINKCYIIMPRVVFTTTYVYNYDNGNCNPSGSSGAKYPLMEIPINDLPFTLPIQLPLSYEY